MNNVLHLVKIYLGALLLTSLSVVQAQANPIRMAPYVDITTLSPQVLLSLEYSEYTLAFAQAECSATTFKGVWGPTSTGPLSVTSLVNPISLLKEKKVDLIISFGKAEKQWNDVMMPALCAAKENKSPAELQAFYQSFLDAYGVSKLDFIIPEDSFDNTLSYQLRNKAIAGLKKANPSLIVSFTLPVSESGLASNALNILNDAKENESNIDIVNLLTMFFNMGDRNLGTMAISAAIESKKKIEPIFPNAAIGITPMIGKNAENEEFSLKDATFIVTQIKTIPFVEFLSFWRLTRDYPLFTFTDTFLEDPTVRRLGSVVIPKITTTTRESSTNPVNEVTMTPTASNFNGLLSQLAVNEPTIVPANFALSFDIKPIGTVSGFGSIIHYTQDKTDLGPKGRIPGMNLNI
jgi:hypothetical protein